MGGNDIDSRIQEYRTGIPDWTKEAWAKPELQGVFLELNNKGKALLVERIRFPVEEI